MKKVINYLAMAMALALACLSMVLTACQKPDVSYVTIEEMYFNQAVPTFVDEGQEVNLSSYLMILPVTVADTVSVTWNSSNEEIATVNANGTVQALREGNVTITANAQDKFASLTLRIDKVKITEFTIPSKFEVYVGSKAKFPITDVSPKGTPLYRFKWEADNDGKKPTYSEGSWYLKADEEREYTLTASVDDADEAKCNVKFVKPSVNKLAFNPASATVEEGSSLSLVSSLQVNPAEGVDADTIKVTWSSSKESVATIDQNGKVQAVSAGKATITANAGGKTATCTVEVTAKPGTENPDTPIDPSDPTDPEKPEEPEEPTTPMENGHEYVDLGLSVMWATCNVGTNSPESCGDYFAWGETATKKEFTRDTYTFNYQGLGKLPISNDAARANWGGKWRMPTWDECNELINNCTWKYEAAGYTVTSNINGKSIFLPVTGCYEPNGLEYPSNGEYWTSDHSFAGAYMLCEKNRPAHISVDNDFYGRAVRPVFTK